MKRRPSAPSSSAIPVALIGLLLCAALLLSSVIAAGASHSSRHRHSPMVGWAADGVRIFGPRGVSGTKLRPADLDSCSGHKHKVRIHHRRVRRYHYHRLAGVPVGCPVIPPATPPAAPVGVTLTTTPGVFPSFDPDVEDYVVHCTGAPVQVSVDTQPSTSISIDGQPPATGHVEQSVELDQNEAFSMHSSAPSGYSRDYHIRCLPTDFPTWNFERFSQPKQPLYAVTPTISLGGPTPSPYVVIFDSNGAPVWWYKAAVMPIDAKVLSTGEIAWSPTNGTSYTDGPGYELRDPDGTLSRTVSYVGGGTDFHDLQEAGNGNFLVESYLPRQHVDTSAFGGSNDATVLDAGVQEVNSAGSVVWSWNSSSHIGLEETGRWLPTALANSPSDIIHINSVERSGDSVIISTRHTDAVYSINRATGDIEWKLGGTPTSKSLTVVDDPLGAYPLGGQHDARILPDGTLTVHENGTLLGRPPRAVRYSIDPVAKTATMLESVTDPDAPSSICCGGARRSSDGSWLMSWGGVSLVTEFAADGARTFSLNFGGLSSYRAVPVSDGQVSTTELRAGMSAMNPR